MAVGALALLICSPANGDSSRVVFDERRAVACLTIGLGAQFVSGITIELIDNIGDVLGFGTAGRGLAIGAALTGKHNALQRKSWEEGG